jgi:hypothetical protein
MAEGTPSSSPALTYKIFQRRHPDYDEAYWQELRALRKGGKCLLRDDKLMEALFPPHTYEERAVYQERKKRAVYIPYAGSMLGAIVAHLMSEPLQMGRASSDKLEAHWTEFLEDVSRPGAKKMSLAQFLRRQIFTALECGRAWALVDLPRRPIDPATGEPVQFRSRAEEEEAGLLAPYFVPLDPTEIINWKADDEGNLLWAIRRVVTRPQPTFDAPADIIRETYTVYTTEGWQEYFFEYKEDAKPQPNTQANEGPSGEHPFQAVPVVCLELPPELWAMDMIGNLVKEHFNKRSAQAWAEYKSLFATLVAYLESEIKPDTVSEHAEDPDRATNQTYGVGRIVTMAEKDRLEYLSGPVEAFVEARASLKELRDEMHRVLRQMALATDNSAAALGRSAESKQADSEEMAVLFREYGRHVREHAEDLCDLASVARGEEADWKAEGMDGYAQTDLGAIVEQIVALETVQIPSATYHVEKAWMIARRVLGDQVDEKTREKIYEEIRQNITPEQFEPIDEEELAEEELETSKRQNGREPTGKRGDDEESSFV